MGYSGRMGLTVSGLCCDRGGLPVLRDVGFDLRDGETLVLRGPNGAGKSTLLRALAGLLPVSAGRIVLDGHDPAADPDAHSERLAYAGHLDAIKPQLTVAENIGFWADLFGGTAGPAIAALDLAPILDRTVHVCSAGQKRRLGLARLLVAPRRLWLLDEPSVSLDRASVARLCAALRDHAASGGLAVIATHAALDLGAAHDLELAPLAPATTGPAADPFLAGAWT